MTYSTLIESAKQGNVQALTTLLNQKLQPKKITAKVSVKDNCLQIILESSYNLPQQAVTNWISKTISDLSINSIVKIKVYGRQTGETFPDWCEEIELTKFQQKNLSELAQKGDLKALGKLFGIWLKPQNITVKENLKNEYLQIMLEASEVPSQESIIPLLTNQITKLEINSSAKIRIYGKQTDEDFPDWHTEINLDLLSKPFEPEIESCKLNSHVTEDIVTLSKTVESEIKVFKLSNSLYISLYDVFHQPLIERFEELEKNENQELDIKKIVKIFKINELESDINLSLEQVCKKVINLSESFDLILEPSQTKNKIYEHCNFQITKVKQTIKQLERVTDDILRYDFPKGFMDDFVDGLCGYGTKEAIAGATIGSFIAPVVGTVIGGMIGGFISGNRQNQEIQELVNRYSGARDKVSQECDFLWESIYESIYDLIHNTHKISLISYDNFQKINEYLNLGEQLIEKENFLESINYYDKILEINPQYVTALLNKAVALSHLGSYQHGLELIEQALKVENNDLALQYKIEILQAMGRDNEAILICDQLIKSVANDYYAWFCKGISLCQLKEYTESIKVWDKLIELDPNSELGWYKKAASLALIGNFEQALDNLKEAIKINTEEIQKNMQEDFEFDQLRNDKRFKDLKDLMESSVGIDYSELKKLLSLNKWEEADQETAKLFYLSIVNKLKKLDKNIEQFYNKSKLKYNKEILQYIPFQDLQTIDKLWLEHSEGKFGFSVQKLIYESLGGTQEFDEGIKNKFGERIGWAKNTDGYYYWLEDPNKLNYDFKTNPKGHLPSHLWGRNIYGNKLIKIMVVFSFLENK